MSEQPDIPDTRMAVLEEIARQELRLSEIDQALKPARKCVSALDRERATIAARVQKLERALAMMRHGVTVSDHAVVRYLERRYGFDFEGVRKEIATPGLCAAVIAGARGWKIAGGTFKIRNGIVTTYIGDGVAA